MGQKCAVLFSNGLDSRLAIRIMKEKGFEVTAVFFNLPFSKNVEKEIRQFCESEKVKLKIFDCTEGKLLEEYLELLKNPEHKRGAGFNPCMDCKIFLLRKSKEFADKNNIDFIVTGEVLGQRPMSQTGKSMKIIEEKSGVKGKILRPVSEIAVGRKRSAQIKLAKEFQIDYPSPAGGCLLCEKCLKNRLKVLIENNLIYGKTLPLVNIGRHFFTQACWFVVGRDKEESLIIEKFSNSIKSEKGKPAIYFSKENCKEFAKELQKDYKTGGIKKYGTDRL